MPTTALFRLYDAADTYKMVAGWQRWQRNGNGMATEWQRDTLEGVDRVDIA